MKKYLAVSVAGLSAVAVAACGTTKTATTVAGHPTRTTTTVKAPPPKPVMLAYTGALNVTGDTYTLKGIATRGATVEVTSDRVPNRHGHWSKTVHLNHGENDFALTATKPGREDISVHLTVTRHWTAAEREAQREAAARRKAKQEAAAAARKAQQEANYKGRATTIPYNELNKDADAQAGKIVTYTGQIFQIQEDSAAGGGIMLLSVTNEGYGLWDDNIWVNYTGHIAQNEGDQITIWGKVEGSKSYDTQIGGTTYVPEVTAKYTS